MNVLCISNDLEQNMDFSDISAEIHIIIFIASFQLQQSAMVELVDQQWSQTQYSK